MLANQSVPLAANATDFAIDFAGGATFAPLVGEEVVLVVRVCHARLNPHPSHTRTRTHTHTRTNTLGIAWLRCTCARLASTASGSLLKGLCLYNARAIVATRRQVDIYSSINKLVVVKRNLVTLVNVH